MKLTYDCDSVVNCESIVIVSVKEVGVLLFFDSSLHLIESLLDELTVLYVKDAIGIAFDLRIMRNHNTSCCTVLTFALWANPVDVENKIHDSNYLKKYIRLDEHRGEDNPLTC